MKKKDGQIAHRTILPTSWNRDIAQAFSNSPCTGSSNTDLDFVRRGAGGHETCQQHVDSVTSACHAGTRIGMPSSFDPSQSVSFREPS
jgi:hypothetical protein